MLLQYGKYYWILLLVLLPACNFLDNGHSDTVQRILGESFQLHLEETARLDKDTQITFSELIQDSRCPLRVYCIWEGEIEAAFRFETTHSSDALSFKGFLGETGEIPLVQVFGGYQIFLEKMDPYPVEGEPSDEIVATLRVELDKE